MRVSAPWEWWCSLVSLQAVGVSIMKPYKVVFQVFQVVGKQCRFLEGTWSQEHDAVTTANLFTTATGVKHEVLEKGFLGAYDSIEEECTRA